MPSPERPSTIDSRRLPEWLAALEARHLADLRFSEVARALRALSAAYVERRHEGCGRALDGAGKRAAFALFYAPLHFLLVDAILRRLEGAAGASEVLDLGCGTGVAGAAWALTSSPPARITGIDVHPWPLREAAWTYRTLGLRGRTLRGDAVRPPLSPADAIVAAFSMNELTDRSRAELLPRLIRRIERGARVLIVEPIASSFVPWWPEWQRAFERAGGRADEWRIPVPLPDLVKRLDQAAGLRHDELTGRTLYSSASPGETGRASSPRA